MLQNYIFPITQYLGARMDLTTMTAEKNSEDTQINNYVPNFNDFLVQVLVVFFLSGKKNKNESCTGEKSIYLLILKPENG